MVLMRCLRMQAIVMPHGFCQTISTYHLLHHKEISFPLTLLIRHTNPQTSFLKPELSRTRPKIHPYLRITKFAKFSTHDSTVLRISAASFIT